MTDTPDIEALVARGRSTFESVPRDALAWALAGIVVRQRAVVEAARELLEVADLRGDSELSHPADDEKLWTARMQTAWDELRAALDAPPEGEG